MVNSRTKPPIGNPSVEEWAEWVVHRHNFCEHNAGESLKEIVLVALRNVVSKDSPQVEENIGDKTFIAPDTNHINTARIQRRALYRHIERMAGMTVPQWDRDCMGDAIRRRPPTAEEVYAHVLKAIAEFPSDLSI